MFRRVREGREVNFTVGRKTIDKRVCGCGGCAGDDGDGDGFCGGCGGSYGERIAGARGGIRDGVIALCRDLCAVGCARAEWQNAPVRRRGCLRGCLRG